MSFNEKDIETAASLIYYGLEGKARPFDDYEYERTVKRYKTDGTFKAIVDGIAAGFKLTVLAVEDFGIVLAPDIHSIFAFSLKDMTDKIKGDEKLLWGVVLIGIAAYLYPRKESFDRDRIDEVKTVSGQIIDEFIRRICDSIQNTSNYPDTPEESPELERVFRLYNALPQIISQAEKSRSTSLYYIRRVFQFLIKKHLALPVKDDPDSCKILPQFRLLVEELTTNEYFKYYLQKNKEAIENSKSQ